MAPSRINFRFVNILHWNANVMTDFTLSHPDHPLQSHYLVRRKSSQHNRRCSRCCTSYLLHEFQKLANIIFLVLDNLVCQKPLPELQASAAYKKCQKDNCTINTEVRHIVKGNTRCVDKQRLLIGDMGRKRS